MAFKLETFCFSSQFWVSLSEGNNSGRVRKEHYSEVHSSGSDSPRCTMVQFCQTSISSRKIAD